MREYLILGYGSHVMTTWSREEKAFWHLESPDEIGPAGSGRWWRAHGEHPSNPPPFPSAAWTEVRA